jgi:hypothetical protein
VDSIDWEEIGVGGKRWRVIEHHRTKSTSDHR